MKILLVVIAVLEAATGIALIVVPALAVALLIGAGLDTPGGLIVARVGGAALLALSVACWLARDDGRSHAARGVVAGMLLYNGIVVTVLVYAALALELAAIGLWPAVVVHVALLTWCVVCLRHTKALAPRQ